MSVRNFIKRRGYLFLAAFVILAAEQTLLSAECEETVVIDSTVYRVPPRWCGHKLDSADIADRNRLVRLPQELCYENYRIYVLPETREALLKMAAAARKEGIMLIIDSGFRSAAYQRRIIERRLAEGESFEKIVRFVAPPGYSEHETGRAVDFVPSEALFAKTPAYQWLKKNAAAFHFYETYPESGNSLKPWEASHWCYCPGK